MLARGDENLRGGGYSLDWKGYIVIVGCCCAIGSGRSRSDAEDLR